MLIATRTDADIFYSRRYSSYLLGLLPAIGFAHLRRFVSVGEGARKPMEPIGDKQVKLLPSQPNGAHADLFIFIPGNSISFPIGFAGTLWLLELKPCGV